MRAATPSSNMDKTSGKSSWRNFLNLVELDQSPSDHQNSRHGRMGILTKWEGCKDVGTRITIQHNPMHQINCIFDTTHKHLGNHIDTGISHHSKANRNS